MFFYMLVGLFNSTNLVLDGKQDSAELEPNENLFSQDELAGNIMIRIFLSYRFFHVGAASACIPLLSKRASLENRAIMVLSDHHDKSGYKQKPLPQRLGMAVFTMEYA